MIYGARIDEPAAMVPSVLQVSRARSNPLTDPGMRTMRAPFQFLAPYRRASTAMVRGSSLPLIRDRGVRAFFLMEVQRD